MNNGSTCVVGQEGVSCSGNTLAETGPLKGGISREINIPKRKGSFPDVSYIFLVG